MLFIKKSAECVEEIVYCVEKRPENDLNNVELLFNIYKLYDLGMRCFLTL